MDDLISKKALIKQIKLANNRSQLGETVNGFNLTGIEVVGLINDMPTAYDVDKVVEQLEALKECQMCPPSLKNNCPYHEDDKVNCEQCFANEALKIVKGAVKDEPA